MSGVGIDVGDAELFQRRLDGDVVLQRHQDFREAGLVGVLDEAFAALGLLDFAGAGEEGFEVAIFLDQQGGGLDADAGDAGDVVDAVAAQGLHVDDPVGRNAELLEHFGRADLPVFHRVEHADAVVDELHQVLVGRDDRDARASGRGLAGVGGDEVVGLEALELQRRLAEGDGGVAHQGELRDQVFRRLGPMGLVLVIEFIPERDRPGVEDACEVRGLVAGLEVFEDFPQHVAEARDSAQRQAV